MENERPLADNILRGIAEIAAYTGETYRQAHWKVERGIYPTTRHGKIRIGLKSELDRVHKPDTVEKPRRQPDSATAEAI